MLLSDLSSVLGQAAPSLQLLELKCRYSLDARRLLPQLLQSQLRALTELHLLAEDRIEGGKSCRRLVHRAAEGVTGLRYAFCATWACCVVQRWQIPSCRCMFMHAASVARPTPLHAGLQLARLTALQRLNIVVDGDPPESFEPDSTLPPR